MSSILQNTVNPYNLRNKSPFQSNVHSVICETYFIHAEVQKQSS